jgi:hypothetical protein
VVAADDDTPAGITPSNFDSQLFYTPTSSGWYYVDAGGFADSRIGTYTAHVTVDDRASNGATTGQSRSEARRAAASRQPSTMTGSAPR